MLPWVCGETWKQWNCNCRTKGKVESQSHGYKVKTNEKLEKFSEEEMRNCTNHYWSTHIETIQDRIFVSNAEQPESEDYHSADGPNDGSLSASDFVFEIGEVLVFRGTDGLPFNLLKVTENVSTASIGPRSKLRRDFLAETSRDEKNIFYAIDPNWTGASMAYAHILRDSDDNAMTVCLDEAVTITETVYKMSVETYHEIQEIAEEFEDSLTQALVPLHADDNYEDDGEEATSEPVEAEATLAYLDMRQ